MTKILFNSNSRYPLARKRIKDLIKTVLGEYGNDKDVEISILVCGDRKMKSLNSAYRKINKTTNVLSFPLEENKFPDGILRLGDIVISYPQVRNQALKNNSTIDEEIDKLIKHGLLSLLGLET